jgi:hypothetical protein
MADWTYQPDYDQEVSDDSPPTLQTKLDDGKVISRVKHTNAPEDWTETYSLSGAQFDTAKAFYDSHGRATAFTKVSYDVYGTPAQERTVRFDGPWTWTRTGDDWFTVTLKFTRHY